MKKSLSSKYYDMFLSTGDPMCLVLARDFKRTEDLRKQIENNNDLSI